MTNKEIHEAVNIASIFAFCRSQSKEAHNAINKIVCSGQLEAFRSEDIEVLRNAMQVLENAVDFYSQRYAENYINKFLNKTSYPK